LARVNCAVRLTPTKSEFLDSLSADLREIRARPQLRKKDNQGLFSYRRMQIKGRSAVALLRRVRLRRLAKELDFISTMEDQGILALFSAGLEIDAENISPALKICSSRSDHNIFKYCRMMQSLPTTNLVGRQIRVLVYDLGQLKPTLMGVFGLSSSPYSMSCRDLYLNWTGNEARQIKEAGLRCIMQLPVCMSVPPYSYLNCGKLIASLALTDTVGSHFKKAYERNLPQGGTLYGLATICATGNHCPIFNRIMIRRGGLYRHIGNTAGYSTAFLSERTMDLARQVVRKRNSGKSGEPFAKSLRMVKSALEACSIPYKTILKLGPEKGVYFGSTSPEALLCLRKGKFNLSPKLLTLKEATSYWNEKVLSKRIRNPKAEQSFKTFQPKLVALSRLVKD